MSEVTMALPRLDDVNRFFWQSGQDGKLRFQRCESCATWRHPPTVRCPRCGADSLAPTAVEGAGTVISYTINHQAWLPGMVVPYTIILVEFDDAPGVRLTSNFTDPAVEAHIGQKVRVEFQQREDVWLPRFAPIEEHAA